MSVFATETPLKIQDNTLRDGHQSLLATRMRLEDMLPLAEKMDEIGFWACEVWGGATFDSMTRFLAEDPWERIPADYSVGRILDVKIIKITEFGAFVDLGEGVEGLIHTSEIPGGTCAELQPESSITVRVLKINPWQQRIGLSLRGVE